jgi:hypothetical protein
LGLLVLWSDRRCRQAVASGASCATTSSVHRLSRQSAYRMIGARAIATNHALAAWQKTKWDQAPSPFYPRILVSNQHPDPQRSPAGAGLCQKRIPTPTIAWPKLYSKPY